MGKRRLPAFGTLVPLMRLRCRLSEPDISGYLWQLVIRNSLQNWDIPAPNRDKNAGLYAIFQAPFQIPLFNYILTS